VRLYFDLNAIEALHEQTEDKALTGRQLLSQGWTLGELRRWWGLPEAKGIGINTVWAPSMAEPAGEAQPPKGETRRDASDLTVKAAEEPLFEDVLAYIAPPRPDVQQAIHMRHLPGIGMAASDQAAGRLMEIGAPIPDGWQDLWSWQERISHWLRTKTAERVKDIDKATQTEIARVIRTGMDEGEGARAIARRLREEFDWMSDTRAEAIARTEGSMAVNHSQHELYQEAGISKRKWLATLDGRVRDAHAAANLDEAEIDEPFIVGGEALMYPGDPAGTPGNTINCFVDGQIKILTSTGYKPIRDIQVGDEVLTHRGQYKRVVRLSRQPGYKGDVVQVRLSTGKRITVTPEHPILTDRGWVNAEDISTGMRVKVLAGECWYCGQAMPMHKRSAVPRTYCSASCASKATTEKQWADPHHRENIANKARLQMEREYANDMRDRNEITVNARRASFAKYGEGGYLGANPDVSESGRRAVVAKYGSQRDLLLNRALPALARKARTGMVKTERIVAAELRREGKTFLQQHRVGDRWVDFYVPEDRHFIEADGERWHEPERDRKRDIEILLAYPDHKITHIVFGAKGEKARETFDLVTLNHAGSYSFTDEQVVSVKRWGLRKARTRFNFAVEDDESYVAAGIVSHNCRCAESPVTDAYSASVAQAEIEWWKREAWLRGLEQDLGKKYERDLARFFKSEGERYAAYLLDRAGA
jgi:hypothetical protein